MKQADLWSKAMAKAGGEKVVDDVSLIKKTIKRQEKQKVKTKRQWYAGRRRSGLTRPSAPVITPAPMKQVPVDGVSTPVVLLFCRLTNHPSLPFFPTPSPTLLLRVLRLGGLMLRFGATGRAGWVRSRR